MNLPLACIFEGNEIGNNEYLIGVALTNKEKRPVND